MVSLLQKKKQQRQSFQDQLSPRESGSINSKDLDVHKAPVNFPTTTIFKDDPKFKIWVNPETGLFEVYSVDKDDRASKTEESDKIRKVCNNLIWVSGILRRVTSEMVGVNDTITRLIHDYANELQIVEAGPSSIKDRVHIAMGSIKLNPKELQGEVTDPIPTWLHEDGLSID